MREYQQAAIELAYLHHRFLRGTAPRDFAARGQELRRPHAARVRPSDRVPRTGGTAGAMSALRRRCGRSRRCSPRWCSSAAPCRRPSCRWSVPGAAEPAHRPAPRWSTSSRTTSCPRLMTIEAPLLAVVGGSTGAGKSTLVNSLVGTPGHRAGRAPADHPVAGAGAQPRRRRSWFGQDRILPDLARTDRADRRPGGRSSWCPRRRCPPGLAILDAPDIDSVEERNRDAGRPAARRRRPVAVRHLGRPVRRPGAVGLPQPAAERSTAVAIVLDRTPPEAVGEVAAHLARMLASRGLKDSPLFMVTEGTVDDDGLLPPSAVADIRGWLDALAADADARAAVVRQTLDGAIRTLAPAYRTRVADAVDEQVAARGPAARRTRRRPTTGASRTIDEAVRRRHPAARRGAGPLAGVRRHRRAAALLESKVGRLRDRLVSAVKGKPQQAERVTVAVECGPGDAAARARRGRRRARRRRVAVARRRPARSLDGAGAATSAGPRATSAAGPSARCATGSRACSTWSAARARTSARTARFLAFGVNGLLGGADGGGLRPHRRHHRCRGRHRRRRPPCSARSCSRRSSATRPCARLAERARADLDRRVHDADGRRAGAATRELLDGLGIAAGDPDRLRDAARRVDDLRFASQSRVTTAIAPTRLSGSLRHARRSRETMTSLLEGARNLVARSSDVGARVDGLEPPSTPARGRLDDDLVDDGQEVVDRAAGRLRLAADHTVVALAGATGSGKSSTFNALTGLELAAVGVRRPTTSWATACVWGTRGRRPSCSSGSASRRGTRSPATRCSTPAARTSASTALVLLDLPDHDSTEVSHHLEVDRLVKLADLLVWVLDPQKYADAAIHDRYLKPLAGHADVMLVVLNHIDTVPEDRRDAMLADVRRLLDQDGLGKVPVLAISARHGIGMEALKDEMAKRVSSKKATRTKLEADVKDAAAAMAAVSGSGKPLQRRQGPRRRAGGGLRRRRRGADSWSTRSAASTRLRARRATGWPVTAWLSRLRPDPLKRLHLDLGKEGRALTRASRTSVPPADPGAAGPGGRRGAWRRRRRRHPADAGRGRTPYAAPRSRTSTTSPTGST